jgi:acetyl-CoA carboxylase carboxyltransferase component
MPKGAMAEDLKLDLKLDNLLRSTHDPKSPRAIANCEALHTLLDLFRAQEDEIRLGGGKKAAEVQRAKGRLTVRERLKLLLDEDSDFLELGLWAAHGMYTEYGGAPSAGVVTGLGRVSGRL